MLHIFRDKVRISLGLCNVTVESETEQRHRFPNNTSDNQNNANWKGEVAMAGVKVCSEQAS